VWRWQDKDSIRVSQRELLNPRRKGGHSRGCPSAPTFAHKSAPATSGIHNPKPQIQSLPDGALAGDRLKFFIIEYFLRSPARPSSA
jgi:hypothetical protein